MATIDKSSISDLVAKYGSSSATAWLEFERYKLWKPSAPVPESSFTPIQGYMERGSYVFAWGNPLVSDPDALPNVARQFIAWCEDHDKRPVWSNVDAAMEEVLGTEFGWSTCSCIYEDVVDPAHVIELTSPDAKGQEGQKVVKDLKKNLSRAEKYNVKVQEITSTQWTEDDKIAVEQGIRDWKASKAGLQIAATTGLPWLDSEHRRYWVAKKDTEVSIALHSLACKELISSSACRNSHSYAHPRFSLANQECCSFPFRTERHIRSSHLHRP